MNLELTDEQQALRESATGALARVADYEVLRDALEGGARPENWGLVAEQGWAGLLVSEANGGAELSLFDAMLLLIEAGKVLASHELLGHLPATTLLDAAAYADTAAYAEGTKRAVFLAARPPGDVETAWTVEARSGSARAAAPTLNADGTVSGDVAWVVDAPGADLLVGVAVDGSGTAKTVAIETGASGVSIEGPVLRYDSSRLLGNVSLSNAPATVLEGADPARAWYVAQALLAAESYGSVETALTVSVQYAKERYTFGRPIGSYQAMKHGLVEILRQRENAYAVMLYAGWSYEDKPEEFALAASAARTAAGHALDYAARQQIATHGGIGATWEHDAPLFFRRSQLSRRLLGGIGDSTDRVAGELLAA
ncbi:MAG: acyl-CoA dehydrogenase family protein [Solirubrobacteraceae bacterium]